MVQINRSEKRNSYSVWNLNNKLCYTTIKRKCRYYQPIKSPKFLGLHYNYLYIMKVMKKHKPCIHNTQEWSAKCEHQITSSLHDGMHSEKVSKSQGGVYKFWRTLVLCSVSDQAPRSKVERATLPPFFAKNSCWSGYAFQFPESARSILPYLNNNEREKRALGNRILLVARALHLLPLFSHQMLLLSSSISWVGSIYHY